MNKILTHKHHIIPRHIGGSDDPSNIVELSVEEHVEAHRKLWEEHGRWQDKLAWEFLSKRVTKEEACRIAASKAHKGIPLTDSHKEKISKSLMGNKRRLGVSHTKETIIRISGENHIFYGKKRPDHSSKMKELGIVPPDMSGRSWKQNKGMCPHCGKSGGLSNMKRYHFDNCGVLEKC